MQAAKSMKDVPIVTEHNHQESGDFLAQNLQ